MQYFSYFVLLSVSLKPIFSITNIVSIRIKGQAIKKKNECSDERWRLMLNHCHPLRIQLLRNRSNSKSLFPRTSTSWNHVSRGSFPDHYSMTCTSFLHILLNYASQLLLLSFTLPAHSANSFSKPRSGVDLGPCLGKDY